MKRTYRPHIALLAAALVTVQCLAPMIGASYFAVPLTNSFDNTEASCVFAIPNTWANFLPDYVCHVPCAPGGGNVRVVEVWDHRPEVVDANQFCDFPPTPTPTPVPTSTPTPLPTLEASPTVAILDPLLTGEVTSCSIKDGFINFRMRDRSVAGEISLTINGNTVSCVLVGSNKDLLSCALPPDVTLVASDFFEFSGEGCGGPSSPGGGDEPPACPPGQDC
jgi:hypothetical protein